MITIITTGPTIKDTKNQLLRLIHELDNYDENMECHLCLYDNNGIEYESPKGFANFVLEPVICEFDDKGNNAVVRVDIAGYL